MSTTAPIEPWATNLILSGVGRLDNAITALGCVMMDLDYDPENGDATTAEAIRWLYEMLRNEAKNIRDCVAITQEPRNRAAKAPETRHVLEVA